MTESANRPHSRLRGGSRGPRNSMKLLGILAFLLSVSFALALPPQAEIEALLGYMSGLDGAVFIRNGSEHTATEAAAHLRMKREKQRERTRSAEDFIALCGSKSSLSGERYQIRFKDGQLSFSDEVLTKHLVEIRKKSFQSSRATAQPPPPCRHTLSGWFLPRSPPRMCASPCRPAPSSNSSSPSNSACS